MTKKHYISNIFFTVALLLFIGVKVSGQNVYSVKWISDSEGLPQNSVKSIFKDKYDFLWLSTENGLVRYDGRELSVFNSSNIPNINSNRMWHFEGNPETDSVFMLNSNANLLLISKRKVVRLADSLHPLTIRKPGDKIPYYNSYVAMIANYYETKLNDLPQIFIHQKGHYTIDIDSIYEYNNSLEKKHTYSHEFKNKTQYFIFENALFELLPNGNLSRYLNGKKSPFTFDKKTSEEIKIFKNNVTKQVFVVVNHQLYRLTYTLEKTIHLKPVFPDFEFNTQNIMSIYYDEKNEILYLGSSTNGLGIVRKNYFKTISNTLLPFNEIEYGILKVDDSTILTGSGAVLRNKKLIYSNNFRETSTKYHIQLDKRENLWLKNEDKIYKYRNHENLSFSDSTHWQTDEGIVINTIERKNDDKVWFSTVKFVTEEGVLYTANVADDEIIPEKILETNFGISAILQLNDHELLLGSNYGLYKVSNYSTTPHFEMILKDGDIRSLMKDENRIWITTYNKGFFLYENNTIYSFPLDRNKYLNSAHCMLEDGNGFFWITTNKGLFQVFKDNLISYASGTIDDVFYQYYDTTYGLEINEFNGGCSPCGAQLGDGSIFFPSLLGVITFNPNDISYSTISEDIYIDEVEIDGVRKFFTDKITINRNFERLRFFVSSPYYEHPYNLHLEVKLESDTPQSWIPLDSENSISFSTLAPGKYTLTARKLSGFDFKHQYKTITINIPPAYWQTTWFRLTIIFITILLIILTVHLRFRYIKLQNLQLAKEVANQTKQLKSLVATLTETKENLKKQVWFQKNMINSISHDLKTPMKYLTMTSKHLYEDHDKKRQDEYENIELIYNSSYQILHFIDKLLIYAKANINDISDSKEKFQLKNLVDECFSIFEIAAKTHETRLQNKVSNGLMLSSNRQILKVVLQNLIDNAVKNCSKGLVTVDAIVTKSDLIITVEDNGVGMNEETLKAYKILFTNKIYGSENSEFTGLGLKIIHELLKILGARLDLQSEMGKGTIFKLILQR